MSAIGSLQRIKRLAIKNLACHKDTSISLPDGLTAITGPNGSGKTFLLESSLATWYGLFPSRPGNIFDCAPIGDSSLEIEFESDGQSYIARRELHVTPKTKSQNCYLISEGKTLAGGPAKLDDFESACRNLVGNPDLLMASIVSSQNLAGDLVDAKPSERQELFRKLLGLEKFAPVSQKARELGKVESGRIQEVESFIQQAKQEIEGKPELLVKLEQITSEIGQKQVQRLNLEKKRDVILAKKEKAAHVEEERARLEEEKSNIQKELKKVDEEISELEAQKKKSEALLASEPEVLKKADRLKELRALLSKVQEQQQVVGKHKFQIEKLEALIIGQEGVLEFKRKSIKEKLAGLEAQSAILRSGEFTFEPCQKCRLLAAGHEAAQNITKIQEELDTLEITILEGDFCQQERKELAELKANPPSEIEKEPIAIQVEISSIRDAEQLLGQISAAKVHEDSIDIIISKVKERKTELDTQWAGIKDKQAPTSNLTDIENQISQADGQLRNINSEVSSLTVNQGKTQSEIERLEKLAGQIAGKKTGLEASRKAIEINDTLDRAFGKDGIPQLLIDSAIPQLHDILNGLLSGLDNRFAISFSTQRALDKGGVKECLEILVADQAGSRDISLFSGGEQRLLRTILRLSWAIFQAQRSGKRLEVFFSDESFDALDRDNAVKLLKIFGKLQERFNQVIIVSHSDELIGDLPNVIRLKKKTGQTEVVQ